MVQRKGQATTRVIIYLWKCPPQRLRKPCQICDSLTSSINRPQNHVTVDEVSGPAAALLLKEVRCPNLTTTLTTALSVVVEDRGRVEATADYSCEKGRRIVGNSQRKCGSNGIWSGSQPRCECPEDAYNTIGSDSSSSSSVSTTSTSTASNTGLYIGLFFGLILAIVFIGVLVYFRMFWAPSRTRELTVLASGQVAKMSGGTARHFLKKALLPLTGWCDSVGSLLLLEVRCPNLTTTLTTALSVVVEDRGRVEATADYSCEKGRRIVGNSQRKCGSNGIWSGSQPRCEYVTCDLPQGLDNGRIVRLNQTLEYGSLVEYHCLPEHRLVGGSFRRSCGELGEWLGGEPKCVLGPEDAYNTIGSDSSSSSSVSTTSTSTASNTGLYIGLFFGLILAIVFIGVLVYFRMFKAPDTQRP
ncbi:sushi, von Willebrand factor type A, EGF and pentraxin domain-containing protein 1-like isoform X14 [Eriocheir sinensis]|uniref:sushi, von Willebrand factor type A, EGF and pentraxin domain-containing protein 1-like isoform X14 n=1 Tax=Eriocheir sinensis TaxID=95602 RepID=UPI0021C5D234|nr:sushi, von Willebrand factor type A, EGF and pentraxin domain-containing protein 1-like isoform X14 [Eriocheir sinensis]